MQAICAYNQIETAIGSMFELNLDVVSVFSEIDDCVTENNFSRAFDLPKQKPGKIAAPKGHEASSRQLMEDFRPESGYPFAPVINNSHFTDVITNAIDVAQQAHAPGDIISEAPEVDDVAAGTRRSRMLNYRRFEASFFQPEG